MHHFTVVFELMGGESGKTLSAEQLKDGVITAMRGMALSEGDIPPADEDIELISNALLALSDANADNSMSQAEFLEFAMHRSPEARSYLDYYNDPVVDEAVLAAAGAVDASDVNVMDVASDAEDPLLSILGAEDAKVQRQEMAALYGLDLQAAGKAQAQREARNSGGGGGGGYGDRSGPPQPVIQPGPGGGGMGGAGGFDFASAGDEVLLNAEVMDDEPLLMYDVAPDEVPSNAAVEGGEEDLQGPPIGLDLEYIHGYRCHDGTRNHVRVAGNGNLVYPAAAVGVSLNTSSRNQSFMADHADDVVHLAVAPDGCTVATVEMGKNARVVVWRVEGGQGAAGAGAKYDADANDITPLVVLKAKSKRGLSHVAFSPDGTKVAAVGQDDEHTVTVWDWEKRRTVMSTATTNRVVLALTWKDDSTVVTAGMNHAFFVSLEDQTARKALFGRLRGVQVQPLVSVAALPKLSTADARGWTSSRSSRSHGASAAGRTGDVVVTGTKTGDLYVWHGRSCAAFKGKAHDSAITALYAPFDEQFAALPNVALASGGAEGSVKLWSPSGDIIGEVNFAGAGWSCLDPSIRSVAWGTDGAGGVKLVVGVRSGEIYQLPIDSVLAAGPGESKGDDSSSYGDAAEPVVTGHSNFETWGLAPHPEDADVFATSGDDATLRLWRFNKQYARHALPTLARCVAWNHDGSMVAVGLGGDFGGILRDGKGRGAWSGRGGEGHDAEASAALDSNALRAGGYVVFEVDGSTLAPVHAARDQSEWISDIKFSPDGSKLAVGSHDNSVCVYDTASWDSIGKCNKSSSFIVKLDWSADGEIIRTNDGAHELLYYFANGSQALPGHSFPGSPKDAAWATHTSPINEQAPGIWPLGSDGTDINATAVSNAGGVIVVGDDFSRVNIHPFPCPPEGTKPLRYKGHASFVQNVTFLADDSRVVSVGGFDKTVAIWRVVGSETEPDVGGESDDESVADAVESEAYDQDVPEMRYQSPLEEAVKSGDIHKAARLRAEQAAQNAAFADPESGEVVGSAARAPPAGGAHNDWPLAEIPPGAVANKRPWMRTPEEVLPRPRWPHALSDEAPDQDLSLSYVHGYRGFDLRNNIAYTADGAVAYPAAALGVLTAPVGSAAHDGSSKAPSQKFFGGHTDDVLTVAMHPDGVHIATGQIGKDPAIHVWSSTNMEPVATLRGVVKRAVAALQFSPDGKFLAAVGRDEYNSVSIYNWQNETLVASAAGAKEATLAFAFGLAGESGAAGAAGAGSRKRGQDTLEGLTVVQAGKRHVLFHSWQGRSVSTRKGLVGVHSKASAYYAAAWLHGNAILGTDTGALYQFHGRSRKESYKAHSGAVYALHVPTAQSALGAAMFSGGADGKVISWSANMEQLAAWSIADVAGNVVVRPRVRALSLNAEGTRLAVGTISSEIIELSPENGAVVSTDAEGNATALVRGHYRDELWGLATSPVNPDTYVTVGDDGMLAVWSLESRSCVAKADVGGVARCITFHPSGAFLAVGLGGDANRTGDAADDTASKGLDGAVKVLSVSTLSEVWSEKRAKEWISDIKFSPDGDTLAVGSHDNKVYIYTFGADGDNADVSHRATFDKHSSFVKHIDFTSDGQYLQVSAGSHELLFANAETGQHVVTKDTLDGKEWATNTTDLAWPLLGVHPRGTDGTDVNAVDVTPTALLREAGPDDATAVVGDDFGRVVQYRYPCVLKKAGHKSYTGHSSHVTKVSFTSDGTHVVSTGGYDRCTFVWEVLPDPEGEAEAAEAAAMAASGAGDAAKHEVVAGLTPSASDAHSVASDPADAIAGVQKADVDYAQTRRSRANLGKKAIVPTIASSSDGRAPPAGLSLEWIYGYEGERGRRNLGYNAAGGVLYFAAGVGIVYNRAEHQQNHYTRHADDITCLDVNAAGTFVATGEMGKRPSVRVWRAVGAEHVVTLPPVHMRGVVTVSFDPSGHFLMSVGDDDYHTVAVYYSPAGDWHDATLVGTEQGDTNRVLFARCLPPTDGRTQGDYHAVTGGKKHIKFWNFPVHRPGGEQRTTARSLANGGARSHGLATKKGLLGKHIGAVVTDAAVVGSGSSWALVAGTTSGGLLNYGQGRSIANSTELPAGVTALHGFADGLVVGDAAGGVHVFDSGLRKMASYSAPGMDSFGSLVRSVCLRPDGRSVLVGTAKCEVWEITRSTSSACQIVKGHYGRGEVWGLATAPGDGSAGAGNAQLAATTGDDGDLIVWDLQRRLPVSSVNISDPQNKGAPVRALSWTGAWGTPAGAAGARAPYGLIVAGIGGRVGGTRADAENTGEFALVDVGKMAVVGGGKVTDKAVNDVSFSPDGSRVAFGAGDTRVYLAEVQGSPSEPQLNITGECNAATSVVRHVCWDSAGTTVALDDAGGEALFVDGGSGSHIVENLTQLKDRGVVFGRYNCVFGDTVKGVWPAYSDNTDVNAVDTSPDGTLLVSGDDYGDVRVFKYPSTTRRSESNAGIGAHSSHVSNVRFTSDGRYVLSTGGNDRTLMQWRVIPVEVSAEDDASADHK